MQLTSHNYFRDQRFSRYMGLSLGVHGALVLFLLLKSLVFPSTALVLQPTVQVDLVALPDQVKAPEQQVDLSLPVKDTLPPAAAAVETPAEEPAPLVKEIEKAKPKEDSALDAKKALEKLRKEVANQKQSEREKVIEAERERLKKFEEKSRPALRGNQVNKGTSASGIMAETMNAYAGHITERLRSNWALPSWLQQKGLRAVARIYIDSTGRIQSFVIRQGSGNESFDNYVKLAIQNSNPFAPPPAEMARQLQSSGMEVTFPL